MFLFWIVFITLAIVSVINLLILLDFIFGTLIFDIFENIKRHYENITTRKERVRKQKEFINLINEKIEENEKWN